MEVDRFSAPDLFGTDVSSESMLDLTSKYAELNMLIQHVEQRIHAIIRDRTKQINDPQERIFSHISHITVGLRWICDYFYVITFI